MTPRLTPAALAVSLVIASSDGLAADPSDDLFELDRLRVKITSDLPYLEVNHNGRKILVMRHQDPGHKIVAPYDKTSRDCPPFCVQPMRLAPGVETIGELELLDYIKRRNAGDGDVLLIDSRTPEWLRQGTIPSAENIPYTRLDRSTATPDAISALLQLEFNAAYGQGLWDFSSAKTLVFFCNGPWCGQSPTSIRTLLGLGYPPHKLKWYRGGLQTWEQFGFTTIKPE